MSWLSRLFGIQKREAELEEEVRSHLEMAAQERVERGEPTKDAKHAARREFGNVELVKETTRDTWGWRWLEDLIEDVRYGLRILHKNPGSTASVIVALALGIGMNATAFSFVNALLLRPPAHVEEPDKLLEVWIHDRTASGIQSYLPLTYPDYLYYRDHSQSFTGMLAFDGDPESVIWNRSGEGQAVQGQLVSGNFFSLLGVRPFLGRTFVLEDDQERNPRPVVVLGHSFWQQHLGSDPNVIGKPMRLGYTTFSVIGVAPAGFAGLLVAVEPDFWAPVTIIVQIAHDPGRLANRQGHWLFAVGRLKPGADAAGARIEADVLAHRIEADHPDTNKNLGANVFPATLVPGPYRFYVSAFTGLLMAVFGLVLLIACVNAATLLLARATSRTQEMAIRSALGAGRGRLIRQTLAESVLLSSMAGCAGLMVAYWSSPLLLALKPASLPLTLRVPLDWRVLLFTFCISLLTGIVFGLAPALRSVKLDAAPALKDETQSASYRKSRMRSLLMIGQIATCVVLLIAATLCVRSLLNASSIDPGFDTQHVATAELDPASLGYSEAKVHAFYQQLSEHVRTMPGVTSVSFVNHLPLGTAREQTIAVEGNLFAPDQRGFAVDVFRVAPGFFQTMSIPFLQGRDFIPTETGNLSRVAIVNETLARLLWPSGDPIDRRIRLAWDKSATEIIGVVKTGKYRSLGEEPLPAVYLPLLPGRRILVARASGDPASLLDAIRREIQDVDPNVAATDLVTMQQYMSLPLFAARTTGLLLGVSGLLALTLTCIGLFGVVSYVVSQRTREIGVRMALGARPRDILSLVVGHGLVLTSMGLVVGLAAAFVLTRFLSSLLYGIRPNDPITLVSVSLGLTAVALLACYVPARKAMRVDPMTALRYE